MFTGTTTLNAANGEEQKTSRFKRELNNMSEKQASQIQIAIWVIGGLCILIMAVTGASVGYVIHEQNKRQDAHDERITALERVAAEPKIKKIEEEQAAFKTWMQAHDEFSRNEVIKINNNLSRIAAKLNVELRQ